MEKIKLIKIKELEDAHHKNNIPEGEERKGYLIEEPKVDQCFFLEYGNFGEKYFRTSLVTEIIDENTFKTMNSIYKIVRL